MSDVIQGADAAPIPPPLESPSPEPKTYAQELEEAAADLGTPKPQNGVTRKSKAAKEEEPVAVAEPAKEPVTQEKLSSGFAKLERQRKAVAKKEAEIAAKEAEFTRQREEYDRSHTERSTALEARTADVDKLLKLYDDDEEKFLEEISKRRNTTVEAFYDKLTRRRLNGGQRAPEDLVAETNAETARIKKELDELKAEKQAEKDAAKKAEEDRQKHEAWQKAIASENAGFINFLKTNAYPLIQEEPEEEVLAVARQIAGDKQVTYKQVADYIEQQLSLAKLKEEADARAKAEAETPKKSAPEPKGKKAEPAKAKTITNSMSAVRSTKSEGTPLTEQDRHERALAAWK